MTSHGYALDPGWRAHLRDIGVDPANVLRRAGLAEGLLQRPGARLTVPDFHSLWHSLEEEAGDPYFSVRLCERARSETFSPPLFAALCSPNLLVALKRIACYKSLVAPVRFDVAETRDGVEIELGWLGSVTPPVSLVMMELMFCVTLARMGTREVIDPIEVTVAALPPSTGPYEAFLGTRVRRGPANRMRFSQADAQRPFLTTNDALWELFEPALRVRLADLDALATTTQRVRSTLLDGLPSGSGSMEAAASRLVLSKRTLQRRLEAEGTSYQLLLRQTREALARHYLRETALPVAEISFLLGFDEPNSLHRAFRLWTGITPDAFRRSGATRTMPHRRAAAGA